MSKTAKDWFALRAQEIFEAQAIESAINLLKENISPEIIAKCNKLPLEKVLELQQQITVTA